LSNLRNSQFPCNFDFLLENNITIASTKEIDLPLLDKDKLIKQIYLHARDQSYSSFGDKGSYVEGYLDAKTEWDVDVDSEQYGIPEVVTYRPKIVDSYIKVIEIL